MLSLDSPGPPLVPRGPMRRGVRLGSHLFLHPVPLLSLQGSGHLTFASTSATDQQQEAYSGTPEVKVPRAGDSGLGWRAAVWRRPTLTDPQFFLHPREVNKRLQDLRSCLSPKQPQGQDHLSQEDEVVLLEGPTLPEKPRLLPLKIRCRADLVRLPIRMVSA